MADIKALEYSTLKVRTKKIWDVRETSLLFVYVSFVCTYDCKEVIDMTRLLSIQKRSIANLNNAE